ncbi:ubiquinone biosynthesis protein COQ9 [Tricharina praecox]|uniref:ubiquinone biosynthesis protein COQ9 n=1 Tax=Tricharina praecox TaxID=43433 RepID=UPI00221F9FE2|nr:ubiquinone biosynthesis protein COQ9 [Tricharina praecox]KAI5855234.1 ubiquinone biosynthesis protein COQ9 [Tricharina praecox]
MPPRLRLHAPRLPQARSFVSHSHPTAATDAYTPLESTLLTTALTHVPTYGFTSTSLLHSLRRHGYPDTSLALFPRGAFSLVQWHLVSQRAALARSDTPTPGSPPGIRDLIVARLRGNIEVLPRWQEALAIMSLGENIPESVRELARLSDDIVFLSGDTHVDTRWYSRRAVVAAVYASAELFMTTDRSPEFRDTWEFVDRRLRDVDVATGVAEGVVGYLGFTARAAINVARSKNVLGF